VIQSNSTPLGNQLIHMIACVFCFVVSFLFSFPFDRFIRREHETLKVLL